VPCLLASYVARKESNENLEKPLKMRHKNPRLQSRSLHVSRLFLPHILVQRRLTLILGRVFRDRPMRNKLTESCALAAPNGLMMGPQGRRLTSRNRWHLYSFFTSLGILLVRILVSHNEIDQPAKITIANRRNLPIHLQAPKSLAHSSSRRRSKQRRTPKVGEF